MIIDKSKLDEAKKALGDRTPDLIAEIMGLEQYDSKNHKALCPFHKEDTPSFIWNPKGGYFKCFGCSATLDIVDAYMHTGLTFVEACEKIFDEAGISYAFGEKGVKTKSQYRYPRLEQNENMQTVYAYWDLRGISPITLDALDVRQDSRGNTVFNYYDLNDVLTMVKYKPSHKIDKKKGEIKSWCQKDADTTPLLFNMNRVNPEQPLLITEGECFKGDTQILTPSGWVRLDEYKNQYVLQVNEDLTTDFVKPIAYIKKHYDGKMFDITKSGNFSLTTTINHNWVYKDTKGNLKKIQPSSLPKYFYYGNIPTSVYHSIDSFVLSNDEIALWIAVSADGTIDVRNNFNYNYCRISLKKQRKIDRLVSLLERLKIPYTTSVNSREEHFFGFKIPKYITKEFPIEFATCTTFEQKRFIIDELVHWDGNDVPNRNIIEYSSKLIRNAEVVQTIAHLCGYRSTISHRHKMLNGVNRIWYKVSILFGGNSREVAFNQTGISTFDFDGTVYCVSVPSGMLLVRQKEHITVCGNCDCLAAIECGYKNAVSVPFGANNYQWIEENWDFLEQFKSIILGFDNDEAGQKALKEIIYRLGSWRTKVMDIPETVEYKEKKVHCKDINELLYFCGEKAVMDAIINAKDSPVTSVVDFADVQDIDLIDMDGIETGYQQLDRELMRIFYGTLTILTGQPSAGKSSFINQLIANSIDQDKNVWLYSKEMPEYITSNWSMLSFAGPRNIKEYISSKGTPYYKIPENIKAKIRNWARGKLFIYKDESPNELEDVYQSMEACVRKYGVKLLIIDNLMMLNMNVSTSDGKYEKQREIIKHLIDFAQKYNVAIILVAHPRKMMDTSQDVGTYDISGTSDIINLTHRSIGLRRVSQKEKEKGKKWGEYDVVLTVIKDRLLGKNEFSMGFHYDMASRRFFTNYEEYSKQFGWDDTVYDTELPVPDCLIDKAMELYKNGDEENKDYVCEQ